MGRGVVLPAGVAVVAAVAVMLGPWHSAGEGDTAPPEPHAASLAPAATPPVAAAPADPQQQDSVPASTASVGAPVPVAKTTTTDRSAWLELPDGTFVPTLNGATGALSLRECWGTRPWSPIERIDRSDVGVDWYVHQDGTRTTTEMKWRADLGRQDALTRIAVPLPEAPPTRAGR